MEPSDVRMETIEVRLHQILIRMIEIEVRFPIIIKMMIISIMIILTLILTLTMMKETRIQTNKKNRLVYPGKLHCQIICSLTLLIGITG